MHLNLHRARADAFDVVSAHLKLDQLCVSLHCRVSPAFWSYKTSKEFDILISLLTTYISKRTTTHYNWYFMFLV